MATPSGSVDPGLLLWLLESDRVSRAAMAPALEHESGLLGLAGSADMSEVVARADSGEARADAAIDVYVHRLLAGIAAMAVALTGLDAVVFTGGVGEHAPGIRARAAAGIGMLGVSLDPERNVATDADQDISAKDARVRSLVVTAREDLEIAREVRGLLGDPTRTTGA